MTFGVRYVPNCPALDAARLEGKPKYEGKPCRTCGNTVRYTINRTCVECSHRANRKKDSS